MSYLKELTEKDKGYYLIKAHTSEEYLSFILMPETLYNLLSDIMIKEDVDYFWGLHTSYIKKEDYETFANHLFKPFGKKVNLKNSKYWFLIVGSIPAQIIPYLRLIK